MWSERTSMHRLHEMSLAQASHGNIDLLPSDVTGLVVAVTCHSVLRSKMVFRCLDQMKSWPKACANEGLTAKSVTCVRKPFDHVPRLFYS